MEGYFTRNQDQSTASSSEQPEDSKSAQQQQQQPPSSSPSPTFQQQTYPYPPPESMTSPANSNANSPSTAAAQPPVVVNYSAGPGGTQTPGPSAGPGQPVPPHAFPFYPAAGMPPPHASDAGDGDRNGAPTQGIPQMVPMMYPGMPMHMAYPYPPGMVPAPSMKSKRRQVKNACTNCQKACKKCDDVRPCSRCVKYGISEECADSQRKERKKGVKRGPYKKRDAKGNPEMADPDMLGMPNGGDANGAQAMGYVAGYPPGFYSQFATGQPISKPDGGAYYPQYYLTPVAHHPPDGENMPQAPFYPAPYLGGPVPYGHQPYAAYAMAQAHPRPDANGSPNSNGAAHPYPYPYNGTRPNTDGNPYSASANEEKSPKGKRPEAEEDDGEDGDDASANKQLANAVTASDHD